MNVEHAKNAMHKADGILVVLPHSLAAGAAVEKTLGLVRGEQRASAPAIHRRTDSRTLSAAVLDECQARGNRSLRGKPATA